MRKAQWENLPAGPELDRLVAETLVWTPVNDWDQPPHYSTDLNAAITLRCVEHFSSLSVIRSISLEGSGNQWYARYWTRGEMPWDIPTAVGAKLRRWRSVASGSVGIPGIRHPLKTLTAQNIPANIDEIQRGE